MSDGRRMSTWLAGRKTLTPISTSRPPLILRVTVPLTTSPSWYLEITISQARIRCAFLRERTISPVSSSIPSSRTSTSSPGCGRRLVFPLVRAGRGPPTCSRRRRPPGRRRSRRPCPRRCAPISKLWPSPRKWSRVVGAILRRSTTAVSSSSLTSNSRSRLRSTMFRFVSIPSLPTEARRTGRTRGMRAAFPASVPQSKPGEKEKPPLHTRGGLTQTTIIS